MDRRTRCRTPPRPPPPPLPPPPLPQRDPSPLFAFVDLIEHDIPTTADALDDIAGGRSWIKYNIAAWRDAVRYAYIRLRPIHMEYQQLLQRVMHVRGPQEPPIMMAIHPTVHRLLHETRQIPPLDGRMLASLSVVMLQQLLVRYTVAKWTRESVRHRLILVTMGRLSDQNDQSAGWVENNLFHDNEDEMEEVPIA